MKNLFTFILAMLMVSSTAIAKGDKKEVTYNENGEIAVWENSNPTEE
jgi:hypothetical protein